jgi:hypothetical protein
MTSFSKRFNQALEADKPFGEGPVFFIFLPFLINYLACLTMILYNVTVKIEKEIQSDWLLWMQNEHIPDVMATGFFTANKMMRMLDPPDEDGFTYAIQYFCENMETLRRYWQESASALQAAHTERFKGKFVAFRTVMEVLKEQ